MPARRLLQHGDDLRARRMMGRQKIQDIHERHRIPTLGAAPEIRGTARQRISPRLDSVRVPAVIIQAGVGVVGMLVNQAGSALWHSLKSPASLKTCPHSA